MPSPILPLLLQVTASLSGQVVDLAPEPGQHLVYCSAEGEVGRLDAQGTATVLAPAGSFPEAVRAVAVRPDGDLSVLDDSGDLYRIPAAGGAPQLFYDDVFLIVQPTDLLVADTGVHYVACRSISANTRAVAQVSQSGQEWGYLLVENQPLGLAADPFGGVLFSDQDGFIQKLEGSDGFVTSAPVWPQAGFSSGNFDGDLALEADGDFWVAAAGELRFVERFTGASSVQFSGAGSVRAVALAAGSNGGNSVWFTTGEGPTTLRELPVSAVAASAFPIQFGPVPSRGIFRAFSPLNVYDLEAEPDGNLLVSGDIFGTEQGVRRFSVPDFQQTEVAGPAQGFDGRVEGIALEEDGAILALQNDGVLRRIREDGPTTVETVFADPLDEIRRGKDLALGRGGELYVPDFQNLGSSRLLEILPDGSVQTVIPTAGTMSASAYPFGGDLIYSQWNKTGFDGEVLRIEPSTGATAALPGFTHINWANDGNWADADLVVDALGQVYTCAEDEFSVRLWDPATGLLKRIGSGYLNRPSGLAIAPSADPASATGWSLYVAERNNLWELPGTPPPMGERLDPGAPSIGAPLGFVPREYGAPTAMAYREPADELLIVTDAGWVVGIDAATGEFTALVGPGSGLPSNLVGITLNAAGDWLIAGEGGTVVLVLPNSGFATSTLFGDPLAELAHVLDIGQSPSGEVLLLADEAGPDQVALVHRLSGGSLEVIGETARAVALARDPLSGDLFAAERGRPGEGGELLRVDLVSSPALAAHWRNPAGYSSVLHGERGALAFDGDGNPFIASSADGRVHAFDRASGARSLVAGQLTDPRDLVVAPGRPGVAGPAGASLFVLDGPAVFEVGINGPAPLPGAAAPGAPVEPLRTLAHRLPGAANTVHLSSPGDAGSIYWILPGVAGKEPGIPVGGVADPSDPRVLPINFSNLFGSINGPTFPNFSGVLDGAGNPGLPISAVLPPASTLAGLDLFCDLTFFTLDFGVPSLIGTVGNTAQLYLGP